MQEDLGTYPHIKVGRGKSVGVKVSQKQEKDTVDQRLQCKIIYTKSSRTPSRDVLNSLAQETTS